MKLDLSIKTVAGLGVILAAIAVVPQFSNAQQKGRFFCDENQVKTMVQTERGSIPLIRWSDDSFPPPYSPVERCKIVSERFRQFDKNGTLKYIKADRINNLPVLCVAAYKGGSCLPNGLLVTFKSGTDPNNKLVRLLDNRARASEGGIVLSTGEGKLISQVNGETYVNMDTFFNFFDNVQP